MSATTEESPRKSLRRLSHDPPYSFSTCQKAAKKAKLLPSSVTAFQHLLEPDKQKRVLPTAIVFRTAFTIRWEYLTCCGSTNEARFNPSDCVNSQFSRIRAAGNPHGIDGELLYPGENVNLVG